MPVLLTPGSKPSLPRPGGNGFLAPRTIAGSNVEGPWTGRARNDFAAGFPDHSGGYTRRRDPPPYLTVRCRPPRRRRRPGPPRQGPHAIRCRKPRPCRRKVAISACPQPLPTPAGAFERPYRPAGCNFFFAPSPLTPALPPAALPAAGEEAVRENHHGACTCRPNRQSLVEVSAAPGWCGTICCIHFLLTH